MSFFDSYLLRDIEKYIESKVLCDIKASIWKASASILISEATIQKRVAEISKDQIVDSSTFYDKLEKQNDLSNVKIIFDILISRKDEFENSASLLESDNKNEPAITLYQCKQRAVYYDEVIRQISSRFGIALPKNYTLKFKSE